MFKSETHSIIVDDDVNIEKLCIFYKLLLIYKINFSKKLNVINYFSVKICVNSHNYYLILFFHDT